MTGGRSDDQQGAVAIVVAISLVVLLGIAAFSVDFGLSYTNTRQLQTAADSAVLAAASTYVDAPGDCATLAADATLEADALVAARALMEDNHENAVEVPGSFDVRCSATGGVEVEWANLDTTPVGLGGVFGREEIQAERRAVASLEVAGGVVEHLRPYFMCSLDLPSSAGPFPTKVSYIGGVTNGGDYAPGCPEPSGNWWTINCPEDLGNNGDGALRNAISNGCQYPLEVVQDPVPAPPDDDGLEAACPPVSPASADVPDDCLEANPGNITNQQAIRWRTVIDNQELVIFPVFCGGDDCTPDPALIFQGGNNAQYPIHSFAAARVCGFHFGNREYQPALAGPCANNPDGLTVTAGGSSSHYMLASFERVQVSGSVQPAGCALGDASCDGGLRQVLLID